MTRKPFRLVHRFSQVALPAVLSLSLGCLTPLTGLRPPAGDKQVKTGGACLDLGKSCQPAYGLDEFVAKVTELLVAERRESARNLVQLYPDLCDQVLRQTTDAQAAMPAMQWIAQIHDVQLGLKDSPLSWSGMLQTRAANPGRYAVYDRARKQVQDLMQAGKPAEAATVKLAKLAQNPLLEIDAHRLIGEVLLQADKSPQAATELTAALERTQNGNPYQSAHVLLLLAEAKRRSGKFEDAVGAWQQAAMFASQLLRSATPVHDPMLWESAAFLRPVSSTWPEGVTQAVRPTQGPSTANAAEAWLWRRVGQWHLDRGEPQGALLAFKRADALTPEPDLHDELLLLQAASLAQINQTGSAVALLTPLVDKPKPAVAAGALAMLGTLKLQTGAGAQAITLLKKAIEIGKNVNWHGRAEAEADLALAYLHTGDSTNGLRTLSQAKQLYQNIGNTPMLLQCLENEATYWEHAGNQPETNRVRAECRAREAQLSN